MNHFANIIQNDINHDHKTVGKIIGQDNLIVWIPLLDIPKINRNMGVSLDGEWVTDSEKGVVVLKSPQSYVASFPLLEEPITYINEKIENSNVSADLRREAKKLFPYIDIIQNALQSSSEYWANLALNWLNTLHRVDKQRLLQVLQDVLIQNWGSQDFRHKISKQIKEMKRE